MSEEHKLDEFIPEETVTSRQRRFLAGLIDAALVIGSVIGGILLFGNGLNHAFLSGIPNELVIFIVFILFRIVCLVLLNGTPGMHILQIQLLNHEKKAPSLTERLLAAVFVLLNSSDYYDKEAV